MAELPFSPANSLPGSGRTLAFIVTEDWFFVSHFLPMARAAKELGFNVVVIARVRDHRAAIEAIGARVLPLEAERKSLNPFKALTAAIQAARMLRQEKAEIVHCIALKSILVGGLAAVLAQTKHRVFALTGLGFLGARSDGKIRAVRFILGRIVRLLGGKRTTYLFENPDDPRLTGLDPQDTDRVTIVGGAGIDPDILRPDPMPPMPPLQVAVVARMLWSKGIDLAVEAASNARQQGANVELSLFGSPDPANPKAVPEAMLQEWTSRPGIVWRGPTRDIAAVWREHHVCCLPSRGGEGLPRTLLEGAACERALVTTDVPGCRTLVRNGIEGFVVPPDNVQALATAFVALAKDAALVRRMGEAARARVLDGFTERQVMDAVQHIYTRAITARAVME